MRLLKLLVSKPRKIPSLDSVFSESFLHFRVEAVRIGLFVGGFSGIYRLLIHSVRELCSGGEIKDWHSLVSGWIAGMSIAVMDPSWHRTLALYMATRMVQCIYNYAKAYGYWHFWGSDWKYGDSLLFIISSAQVMYAYVMRPETLPASYYKFIVRQGPIDEVILQAVRDNNRGRPVNLDAVNTFLKKTGGQGAVEQCKQYLTGPNPLLIPSRALHPHTPSAWLGAFGAFKGTAMRIFPVYLSLVLAPTIVLRYRHFVSAPLKTLASSIWNATQSTLFLATFCGGYQAFVLLQRYFLQRWNMRDNKLWYYIAALVSGLSILIERKSRRSELALYAFPRGMDSLYMILYEHKLAFRVPHGEKLLFALSMGVIMWFYERDTENLSPLVTKLLGRFIHRMPPYEHGIQKRKSSESE